MPPQAVDCGPNVLDWFTHVIDVLLVSSCRLRRERGIHGNIPVLLSTEKPRCSLVSAVDMENGNPLDYQVR